MPEWTVQKIKWLQNLYGSERNYEGRHFIICNPELWNDFDLQYKTVVARLNSILDQSGNIIATVSEDILLETKKMNLLGDVIDEFPIDITYTTNVLMFSKDFGKEYGIRKGEYVNLILTGISGSSSNVEIKELIYPKRFITGKIEIQPSGGKPNPIGITEPLLEQSLEGDFYKELIQEINIAYSYQMYRSTIVLLRKLLENLLIDLLRTRYGMKNAEFFYNTEQKRFLEFYQLIDKLNKSRADFSPFTSGFDDNFFQFINRFRENANSNAHALESFYDKEEIEKDKKKLNHNIKIITNSISAIKNSSK